MEVTYHGLTKLKEHKRSYWLNFSSFSNKQNIFPHGDKIVQNQYNRSQTLPTEW